MGKIIDKATSAIKQAASDKKLPREGKFDQTKGNVKRAVEDTKHSGKAPMKK
jgi:uncharacterized protein YjbJ (UPF0337 family)